MTELVGSDQAWRRYERRKFKAAIVDDAGVAVNLSGVQLEWTLLLNERDTGTPQLHKSSGQFLPPEGTPVPNIAVWEVSDTESASIPSRSYWMYLWDRTNDACLLAGRVLLLPGVAEVP